MINLFFMAICIKYFHNNEGFELFAFYEIICKVRIIEHALY